LNGFSREKNYGSDGKCLSFVTGSLGNISADVCTFVEFIAGVQTTRSLQWRNTTSREQLFSMRHFLVSPFGLFAARL
jgi:hypothetical protein